ncbi:hypothetical protein ABW21_db0202859 [Orbilia brochopaga]|nr:hypothetical protein ABW21_db0202859 [Drechslerella brochopaga]
MPAARALPRKSGRKCVDDQQELQGGIDVISTATSADAWKRVMLHSSVQQLSGEMSPMLPMSATHPCLPLIFLDGVPTASLLAGRPACSYFLFPQAFPPTLN